MDLRQLKIFCAVVDHGSFTAAAEAVHTVQSNVTMRVKELEAEHIERLASKLKVVQAKKFAKKIDVLRQM